MSNSKKLRLYQFNVGAGDHLAIELPNGEFGIIDFHYSTNKFINQKNPPICDLLEYLIHQKKKKKIVIAFLCLSHYDLDHLFGVDAFLSLIEEHSIQIKRIWLAGEKERGALGRLIIDKMADYKEKKMAKKVDDSLEFDLKELRARVNALQFRFEKIDSFVEEWKLKDKANQPIYAKAFDRLSRNLSNNIKANVLAPLDCHIERYRDIDSTHFAHTLLFKEESKNNADRNLISSVIVLEHDHFRLVFGGDAHNFVWEECLSEHKNRELGDTKSNFIKVSHHGSKNASSENIWLQLIPEEEEVYFGISAGTRYSHPASNTLDHINNACDICKVNNSFILATNACYKSLKNLHFEEENLDHWFPEETEEDQQKLQHLRSFSHTTRSSDYKDWSSPKPDKKKQGLLAYIYEFDLHDGSVTVKKGMSSHIPGYRDCLFQDQEGGCSTTTCRFH